MSPSTPFHALRIGIKTSGVNEVLAVRTGPTLPAASSPPSLSLVLPRSPFTSSDTPVSSHHCLLSPPALHTLLSCLDGPLPLLTPPLLTSDFTLRTFHWAITSDNPSLPPIPDHLLSHGLHRSSFVPSQPISTVSTTPFSVGWLMLVTLAFPMQRDLGDEPLSPAFYPSWLPQWQAEGEPWWMLVEWWMECTLSLFHFF